MKASFKRQIMASSMARKRRSAKHETKEESGKDRIAEDKKNIEATEKDSLNAYLAVNDSIPGFGSTDTVIVLNYRCNSDSVDAKDLIFLERFFSNHKNRHISEVTFQEYYTPENKHRKSGRVKQLSAYVKEWYKLYPLFTVNRRKEGKAALTGIDCLERMELHIKR